MRLILSLACLLLIQPFVNGQLVDIVRVEYTTVPGIGSDFDFNRKRIAFNYPVKLKNEAYLFFGLEYSAIDLNFNDSIPNFDQTKTDEFRLLDVNLTYTYKIDEDWRFAARLVPGFSSNLETNEFLFDDTFISGTMVLIKDKKEAPDVPKPYRIIVGVAYSNTSGVVFPIPFISFYKKFHPKWSYNLGVPTTNLQFHASERFRLKLLGQLDGFTSNLQEELLVNEERLAERIRMNLLLVGLRYEYKLTDHVEMYLNTTHSIRSRIQLRANRRTILSFTKRKVLHFTGGVRLKI
ncbi:MAG: DUF6268 family outer membrane beta-barrel protein [Cyclobacteriaceae bacterium]